MAKIHLTNGTTRDVPLLTSAAIGYVANSITIGAKDVSQLRTMLNRGPAQLDTLLAQLEARFPENRIVFVPEYSKLSVRQRAILDYLFSIPEGWSMPFERIGKETFMSRDTARLVTRALAKMGITQHIRGLMNEDGEVAGSGYMLTDLGRAVIKKHEGGDA